MTRVKLWLVSLIAAVIAVVIGWCVVSSDTSQNVVADSSRNVDDDVEISMVDNDEETLQKPTVKEHITYTGVDITDALNFPEEEEEYLDITYYKVECDVKTPVSYPHNAGQYEVVVSIKPAAAVAWLTEEEEAEGISEEITLPFTVDKKIISVPTDTTFDYTGNAITLISNTADYQVVSQNNVETEVGTYDITIELSDSANTAFANSDLSTMVITYTIQQTTSFMWLILALAAVLAVELLATIAYWGRHKQENIQTSYAVAPLFLAAMAVVPTYQIVLIAVLGFAIIAVAIYNLVRLFKARKFAEEEMAEQQKLETQQPALAHAGNVVNDAITPRESYVTYVPPVKADKPAEEEQAEQEEPDQTDDVQMSMDGLSGEGLDGEEFYEDDNDDAEEYFDTYQAPIDEPDDIDFYVHSSAEEAEDHAVQMNMQDVMQEEAQPKAQAEAQADTPIEYQADTEDAIQIPEAIAQENAQNRYMVLKTEMPLVVVQQKVQPEKEVREEKATPKKKAAPKKKSADASQKATTEKKQTKPKAQPKQAKAKEETPEQDTQKVAKPKATRAKAKPTEEKAKPVKEEAKPTEKKAKATKEKAKADEAKETKPKETKPKATKAKSDKPKVAKPKDEKPQEEKSKTTKPRTTKPRTTKPKEEKKEEVIQAQTVPEQPTQVLPDEIEEQVEAVEHNVREEVEAEEVDNLLADDVAAVMVKDDRTAEEKEEAQAERNNTVGHIDGSKKTIINVDQISANFEAGEVVNLQTLKDKGLIGPNIEYVKVLARGMLTKPLTVEAQDFSMQAVKMIVLTGGKVHEV
jgi:hypothetical protein